MCRAECDWGNKLSSSEAADKSPDWKRTCGDVARALLVTSDVRALNMAASEGVGSNVGGFISS